ncbi:MAG: hypothetical protein AAF236_07715 [Verrucomicrobiota bacterium]
MTLFSTTARWALSLTGLLATAVAAWWFLFRPLSRKLTLTHIARILEVRHPELQERISTAVELLSSDDPDSIKGSEELIGAVVDSAVLDVEAVDPKTEFSPSKVNRFAMIAAFCAGVVLILLAIWPNQAWTLLTRAVAPFANIGNAWADTLVVDPGDIRIASGDTVTIEMSAKHKRLRRAEIRRTLPDGSESVERMTLIGEEEDGTKRFSVTFQQVDESFDYRIRAGSALTEYFEVTAVEPPEIANLEIAYAYPAYTGLESRITRPETGEIRAVVNTRVTVTAELNKTVELSQLVINELAPIEPIAVGEETITWEFPLNDRMSGGWRFDLADSEGFTNAPASFPIQALPDKAPTVQITDPIQKELRLRPTESLPIRYDAVEDFGFARAEVLVTPERAEMFPVISQPLPQATGQSEAWSGEALLQLGSLDLDDRHRRLTVQLRLSDNRPRSYEGPGIGLSETFTIIIDRNAKSLAEQMIEEQKKQVREQLEKAKQELYRARDEMRQVEQESRRVDELSDNARDNLEDFSEHTEAAQAALEEVAEKLENGVFNEQAETAERIAEESIGEAQEEAAMVPLSDEKQERVESSETARKQIEEALKEVDKLARELRENDDAYEAIAQLNRLANRQQEIAERAAEKAQEFEEQSEQLARQENPRAEQKFSESQQQALNEFQREQERVQQDLGEMVQDDAEALADVLEEQREQADALAEKAEALAEQQEALTEMTQEAASSKENGQEELRQELLAQLQEQQSQLAEEAQQKAAEAAAEAQAEKAPEQPTSPSQESSLADSDSSAEPDDSDSSEPSSEANESSDPASPSTPEMASTESPSQPESNPAPEADSAAQSTASEDASSEPSPSQTPAEAEASALAEAAEEAARAAEALAEENLEGASQSAAEASESLAEAAAAESAEMAQAAASEASEATEGSTSESGESDQGSPSEGSEAAPANQAEAETPQQMASEGAASEAQASEGDPSSADEGSPQTPGSLAELAERQETLAEQIEAVMASDLQGALAMMEEDLADQAAALQDQAESLEETFDSLEQQAAESATNQAENNLDQAESQADRASDYLSQAQDQQAQAEQSGQVESGELASNAARAMSQSKSGQQQAESRLEQAAKMLSQASTAVSQSLERLEPTEMSNQLTDSADLAEGFSEVSESASSQSSAEAAQQAQEAANSLSQLARQAMEQLGGQQGPPGQESGEGELAQGQQPPQEGSEKLNESGAKTADLNGDQPPPELEDLGISAEDWARFRGALVGGNASAIETDLPPEYRELIGRYFQVIAKEAANQQ